jgi:lipopolysaccharide transport system ATP-binding protein
MSIVISVENLSKTYRLGQIGTGTFRDDLKLWWAKTRGKPNPLLKIGQIDHGNRDGEDLWALRDVSFSVAQGEVLGIIGRNGAGKSTLLKILSRITAPTSGKIKMKGRVASLLEVGTGFHPDLTGRENIYLNGAILGMSRREVDRKFDEIVDFSEIEKFIDTPVKRYSSGMYVRLAFAVAAHLEPEILIVDEVLAVGDAEFQKKCLGKMGSVAQGGRTVLFVSHNMTAIEYLCENVLLLQNGQIEFYGDHVEGIAKYLHTAQNLNAFTDLREHPNRVPNARSTIASICIKNSLGELKREFYIGENITLEVDINRCSPPLNDVALTIGVFTRQGQIISSLYSNAQMQTDGSLNISNPARFRSIIKAIRYTPGTYLLKISLSSHGQVVDRVDNVASFEILPSDVYKTGKSHIVLAKGIVVPDVEWELIDLTGGQ